MKSSLWVQVLGIGVKNYWSSHWNKLDLMVVLLSIADVGYELFDLVSKQGSSETIKYLSPAILRNVRFLRLFRIARVFRLIKVSCFFFLLRYSKTFTSYGSSGSLVYSV